MDKGREKLRKTQVLLKLRLLQQGKAAIEHERELGSLRMNERTLSRLAQDYQHALAYQSALLGAGVALNPDLQTQRITAIEGVFGHAAAAQAVVEAGRDSCRKTRDRLVNFRVRRELASRAQEAAAAESRDVLRLDEDIDCQDAQLKSANSGGRHG